MNAGNAQHAQHRSLSASVRFDTRQRSDAKALTLFDVGRLEGRSPPDDLVVARSRSPPTATKLASYQFELSLRRAFAFSLRTLVVLSMSGAGGVARGRLAVERKNWRKVFLNFEPT